MAVSARSRARRQPGLGALAETDRNLRTAMSG